MFIWIVDLVKAYASYFFTYQQLLVFSFYFSIRISTVINDISASEHFYK